jgi:hypothetical protein
MSVSLLACKSTKIEEKTIEDSMVWTPTDIKPDKALLMPNAYTAYALNIEVFKEQLQNGEVDIPMPDGSMSRHKVEDSQTMSPELQAKFPQIRSFKGYDLNNTVCQSRIDQKNDLIKCVVYCNDSTIYIQDLHDLGLHFVFYKKDLPDGVGTVNE